MKKTIKGWAAIDKQSEEIYFQTIRKLKRESVSIRNEHFGECYREHFPIRRIKIEVEE